MAPVVLHVIKQLALGGAEHVVVQMATHTPEPWEVSVCAFREGERADELREAGIETRTFFPPPQRYRRWPKLRRVQEILAEMQVLLPSARSFCRLDSYRRLCRVIDEVQPDVIHSHMMEANVIGGAAAARKGVPHIAHVHGHADWRLSRVQREICAHGYRYVHRGGSRFVAVSHGVAEEMQHHVGIGSEVIHNGVDLDVFSPECQSDELRDELGLPADTPIVGCVGRLEYQKNPKCLVRSIPRVLERVPEAHFVSVGDGQLRVEVQQLAKDLGVTDSLHLLGERRDVPDLLPQFDIFALPSRFEGLPLCFAEAMACGLPTVGTDVEGTREIVADEETGFLVESDDDVALGGRIVELLEDDGLRAEMGRAGRARVEEKFSIPSMIGQVVTCYEEALDRAGA